MTLCELFNINEHCKQANLRDLVSCENLAVSHNNMRLTLHMKLSVPVFLQMKKLYKIEPMPIFHLDGSAYSLEVEGKKLLFYIFLNHENSKQ